MAKIFRTLLVAAVNAIKEFLAFATKDCFYTGLLNCKINGDTLSENNGIISGFGTSQKQYIISTNKFDFTADTWAIISKIKFTGSRYGFFLGSGFVGSESKFSILLGTNSSNNITALLSSIYSGGNWDIANTASSKTFELNTYYWIKYYFTGTTYKVDLSTTGEFTGEEENFINISSSTKVYNADNYIMWGTNPYGGSASQNLNGEIDMKEVSVTTNGVTIYYYSTSVEEGDTINLNDGMATSNYDWSAYPNNTTTGVYTQTGTVEAIKEIGGNTVYVTQEPQQDNKDVKIEAGQKYYAYTNENDSDDTLYTTDNPINDGNLEWTQPILTSNGTVGGDTCAIETDIPQLSDNAAWHGFDNNASTQFHSTSGNTVGYFTFYSPDPLCVTKITFTNQYSASRASAGGTIYGSNDNNNWETITTYTHSNDNSVWDIDLSNNTKFYKYWKVYSNGTRGDSYWTFTQCTFTATKQSTPSTLYENTGTTEFTPIALSPQPEFEVGTGIVASDLQNGAVVIPVKEITSSLDMVIHFKTGSSWPNYCLCDSSKDGTERNPSVYFQNYNSYLVGWFYSANYTSGNADIANDWNTSFQPNLNSEYWFKLTWDGTYYRTYSSTDGINYTTRNYYASSTPINWANNYLYLGNNYDTSTSDVYQNIYLNGTYIKVDGETIFNGSTAIEGVDFTTTGCTLTGFAYNTIKIGNNLYKLNDNKDEVKDIPGLTVNIDTVDNTTINTVTVSTPTEGYIDIPYYAYSYNTDTLYTTDNPVSLGTPSLINCEKIGNPTQDGTTFTNFSQTNNIKVPVSYTNTFKLVLHYKAPSTVNDNSAIIMSNGDESGNTGGMILRPALGSQYFRMWAAGSSYWSAVTDFHSNIPVKNNSTGWLMLDINGLSLTSSFSSDGNSWTQMNTYTMSESINWYGGLGLGGGALASGVAWGDGKLYLEDCYMECDGIRSNFIDYVNPSIIYNSSFEEITPQPSFTIGDVGLNSDVQIEGTLYNNKGLFSGFSLTNFLNAGKSLKSTNNAVYEFKFTTGAVSGTSYQQVVHCEKLFTIEVYNGALNTFNWQDNQNKGNVSVSANTTYYAKVEINGTTKSLYVKLESDADYSSTPNWSGSDTGMDVSYNSDLCIGMASKNEDQHFYGVIDMANSSVTIDGQTTTFYNAKSGIIIENDLYERNSTKDDYIRTLVPATIETSANITTSNNDNVITDGGYHFFNLTTPTGMTPIIESSGISYQTSDMPLLLKKNSGVGFLLKDGNNAYYRNTWVITRDYDLHYQQINFSYPSGATVTCKVNNAPQNDLTPICYCGDIISWTCDNAGTITTGTYTVKYSTKDGNIQTITIS